MNLSWKQGRGVRTQLLGNSYRRKGCAQRERLARSRATLCLGSYFHTSIFLSSRFEAYFPKCHPGYSSKHLAFWNRYSKTYCSHQCKWSGRKPGWFVLFARHHTCWRAEKQKLHALSLQTRCQRSASHPLSRGCWIERECSKCFAPPPWCEALFFRISKFRKWEGAFGYEKTFELFCDF